MKISKIIIDNFRSLKRVELGLTSFSVLIGQNNHGKTNFFEAIEWFFTKNGELEDIFFLRDTSKVVSVEVEFTGLQKGLSLITNEKQKKLLSELFGTGDLIRIRRSSEHEEAEERQLFNPKTDQWENPLGRDSTWKQFLPTLEYVGTKKFLEDVAKYGKSTPINRMLSTVLETMLTTDAKYAEFKETFNQLFGDMGNSTGKSEVRKNIDKIGEKVGGYLQKQFPDCVDVTFRVEDPELEDLFKKFRTTVDDGIRNDSSEKGDGMQRALMLAIIQAYAAFRKENGESKEFIFLIDEAELHLHPTAQRALKNALYEVAQAGDQVLINTHSSVLVADEAEGQQIFKVEKINKITNIFLISLLQKPNIVYELLGGSPADLLLPRNFLIVEGRCEQEFLARVVARWYGEKPPFQIIPANGDIVQAGRSFSSIVQIFKPLETSIYKDKAVIFVDKQNQISQRDTFLASHSYLVTNTQFFESAEKSIEEYYPPPWKQSANDLGRMSADDKISLAKTAGEGITREDFESHMSKMFDAIERCWSLCYQ